MLLVTSILLLWIVRELRRSALRSAASAAESKGLPRTAKPWWQGLGAGLCF